MQSNAIYLETDQHCADLWLSRQRTIGPYQVIEEIGRGGMALVFRAWDPVIGRLVAIKVSHLEDVTGSRDRLFREARASGALTHPGIVTTYQVGEDNHVAYIAMEFVNGPTLQQLLDSGSPLDPGVAGKILTQTAAALDYAHKKGIVHRDIKPANIMVHENDLVKICDFGIAGNLDAMESKTHSGLVLGTPHYMSPEQISGKALNGRTDQYSLAVIAYQIVTGRLPFEAETVEALFHKMMFEPPVPPSQLNLALSGTVDEVFVKALSKDPNNRYQTCASFVQAMLEATAPPQVQPQPVQEPGVLPGLLSWVTSAPLRLCG